MKPRPTGPQPNDRPLPKKHRFGREGVLVFKLTASQRAKIALGYNVRVSVTQHFERNPGDIQVATRIDVTTQTEFDAGDRIAPLRQAPKIEKDGAQ